MITKIIFMASNIKYGSSKLRASQICEHNQKKCVESIVLYQDSIDTKNIFNTKKFFLNYKNALFIWIKTINKQIYDLIPKNNIHVLDMVDNYILQKDYINEIINNNIINGIIVNNNFTKNEIKNNSKFKGDVFVLYHHYDPALEEVNLIEQDELKFGFMGSLPSLKFTDNFLHYKELVKQFKIEMFNTEDLNYYTEQYHNDPDFYIQSIEQKDFSTNFTINFNCHISIRIIDSDTYKYKTTAKIATAAALGHNIITTYEESVKDIIPIDYPFLLFDDNVDSVKNLLNTIILDYNQDKILWNKGLEIMKTVKSRLSINNIVKDYNNLFDFYYNLQISQPNNIQITNFIPSNTNTINIKPNTVQTINIKPNTVQTINIKPNTVQTINIKPNNSKQFYVRPSNVRPNNIKPSNVNQNNIQVNNNIQSKSNNIVKEGTSLNPTNQTNQTNITNRPIKKLICFVSTFIGDVQDLDISNKFVKIDKYDYLFFTNIPKNIFPKTPWEVIEINMEDFKYLNNNVKISRYFKFCLQEYIKTTLKRDYSFIVYCDSNKYPLSTVRWEVIMKKLMFAKIPIIQYPHRRYKEGINKELECIVKAKKDTQKNMDKTREYLIKIDNSVNLSTPVFYENTLFIYKLDSPQVSKQMNEFWKYYVDSPTYRDQPLWNFLYLKNKMLPITDINLPNYFGQKPKIERSIDVYNKINL